MAGYIFTLDNLNALEQAINDGVFSVKFNTIPENKIWKPHQEGTFADYITMKEGDNVYFFHKRKLYGIGELININKDCKFLNFPNADIPLDYTFSKVKDKMILNRKKEDTKKRIVCTFKASPYFFKEGIDMDEVLSSNPNSFKMLRAFWRVSFIKIDDEENKALKDVILKNNEENLLNRKNVYNINNKRHDRIKKLIKKDFSKYEVTAKQLLTEAAESNGKIKHELALEAGILDYIFNKKSDIFGDWDYLSRQVIASPFKPIDYMDKMDIFGYKYIPGFQTVSKFLVIEIKKDQAKKDDINQVMKYVDWINQEYSFGDYHMIEAFLVAYSFPKEVIDYKNKIAKRNYVKGTRPVKSFEWKNLKLIEYKFDSNDNILKFKEIN